MKKSPLKEAPLRLAGQSVQEEIDNLFDEKLISYFLFPLFFAAITLGETVGWYFDSPRQPLIYAVATLVMGAFAAFRIFRLKKRIHLLKQARDGERAVAQFLEDHRAQGFYVFHDIVGNNFNLDHVLIGPKGVFTVETKTWGKPVVGEPKIYYDGERLQLPDATTKDPIVQAKAQASWLKDLFKEETGKDVTVQPVVLFPGWYIERKAPRVDVWVLNPKALPKFIENTPATLEETDVHMFKSRLSQYVRKTKTG